MSNQRYTPEFKDEAVRQVLEKGHSVPEVAERLGVSTHSLYKCQRRSKIDPPLLRNAGVKLTPLAELKSAG
jgi:transposase